MYVIVSTYREWDAATEVYTIKVGAVYGPFETKVRAMSEVNAMEFPSPELVEIRQVHQP